jgi:chitinase
MLKFIISIVFLVFSTTVICQQRPLAVIAYYAGNAQQADSFAVEKLSHIIFSFCHLNGNKLNVRNARDTSVIQKLVSLKARNPSMKVLLSLGGWGGCETCSSIFSNKKNRKAFALSVKELSIYFGTDGIDLDWEYPAIAGFPGHQYKPEDRKNFTALVKQLRKVLGNQSEITFAAGGFNEYIEKSIDWKKVIRKINYVNLMTYDLVGGFATTTGHHTPLYSTSKQIESIDNCISRLLVMKVPAEKLVLGAAFYGRMWEGVADADSGLYQKGTFKRSIAFKNFSSQLSVDSGFVYHWDEKAKAPYFYNPSRSLFVTHDDARSIALKTQYAIDKGLGGIMFWELSNDAYTGGLLDVIDETRRGGK